MRFTLLTNAVGLMVLSGCAALYSYDDYEDGAGGQGGGKPPSACTVDGDCAVDTPECAAPLCKDGQCGVRPLQEGQKTAAQAPGDCKVNVCSSDGRIQEIADNDDVQADSNDCTKDVCVDGKTEHPLEAAGSACGQSDATRCDDGGHCVGCTSNEECPAATACAQSRCENGTCVSRFESVDTVCSPPECVEGNAWSTSRCDDAGSCVPKAEDCSPFLCTPEGCPTSCSDSSQCQPGFHCEDRRCHDCRTCGEWLNGAFASEGASFCARSAELHAAVVDCVCGPDRDCLSTLECSHAICDGSEPVPDSCTSCERRCPAMDECAGDL